MPAVPLTCPHCGGQFDYDFVPGVSISALRLAGKRYMRCPICQQWGTFDLRLGEAPAGALRPESPPRYSDRRLLARRGAWVVVPIAVVLLSLIWIGSYPSVVFWIDVAMLAVIAIGAVVLLLTSRLPLVE